MSVLNIIVVALAFLSLPVMYAVEWRLGYGRRIRIAYGVFVGLGIVSMIAVSVLFLWKSASAPTDVRGWARDAFLSFLCPVVTADLIVCGLLGVAALIRHKMFAVRRIIGVLLSVIVMIIGFLAAFVAGGGYFDVAFYIRWLIPGLVLLPHICPLCEMTKKSC